MQQDVPQNRECFECGAPNPTWASLPNAVFLCLPCSGIHRSLGVHISFVRSTTMDSWSDKQLKMMMTGGNDKLKEYFTQIGIYSNQEHAQDISWKYRTKGASYYREQIKAQVEERETPQPPSLEEALQEDTTLAKSQSIQQTNKQQSYQPMQYQQPQDEDALDKMKTFFVSGFQKTSEAAKEAKKKLEDKYNDEEFQTKLNTFKEDFSKGATEFSEKTKVVAEKSYNTVKDGTLSAWSFLKTKFNELQNKQPQQVEQFDIIDQQQQQQ